MKIDLTENDWRLISAALRVYHEKQTEEWLNEGYILYEAKEYTMYVKDLENLIEYELAKISSTTL